MDPNKKHHKRALYYRDDNVNDGLFILYTPNSYYTGVVEISGVELKVILQSNIIKDVTT